MISEIFMEWELRAPPSKIKLIILVGINEHAAMPSCSTNVAAASSLTQNRQVPGTDTGHSGMQFWLIAYKGF